MYNLDIDGELLLYDLEKEELVSVMGVGESDQIVEISSVEDALRKHYI